MLIETIIGGITGLVGSAVTGIFNYKTQKLKNEMDKWKGEHVLKKMDKEMEIIKTETEASITITTAEIEGAIELSEADAYKESQKHSAALFAPSFADRMFAVEGWLKWITIPIGSFIGLLFGVVDFLKTFMRPGLTMYLTGMTTYITIIAYDIIRQEGMELTADQATAIFMRVINIVVYLTVTCVTWWFADRRMAKFLMRLDDGNLKK